MIRHERKPAVLTLLALMAALALLGAPGASAETLRPLPRSSYGVRPACADPAPGRAGCLALQLVPQTAQARARTHPLGISRNGPVRALSPAAGDFGLRPADLHTAYELPSTAGTGQTIALVDAYHDPTAEADLKAYDEEFGLPPCTAAGGCFEQVNQEGESANPPFPANSTVLKEAREAPEGSKEWELAREATGWALEISLDIETAHATCRQCRILLVEAESPSFANLDTAEASAARLGATEISNSWGGPEEGLSPGLESSSAFNHPGIVITASAGDDGYLSWNAESASQRGYAEFPASSPHVVAVGGTRLQLQAGGSWSGETVWNGNGAGGGGCSVVFTAPAWQQNVSGFPAVGCGSKRAVSDVAADADPYSGLAVHDTSPECETSKVNWCTIGGTSLASPLIASIYALAGGSGGAPYPARTLYLHRAGAPASLHDVTQGSNGECPTPFVEPSQLSSCEVAVEGKDCGSQSICLAGVGYDGPSGVGTPKGIEAFQAPTGSEAEPEPKSETEGGSESLLGGGGATPPTLPKFNPPVPIPALPLGSGAAPIPSGPPQITAIGLTLKAVIALNRIRPRISQLSFLFTASAAVRVHATLAKRGHARWRGLPASVTLNSVRGRNTAKLRGHGVLSPGRYRLTVSPLHGLARSMVFSIS
ncbi:MAG: S53 family peptidase [Solirubrobacterales bacterium]|nr:S53 family peptidase [Solirubrobacterales bacterium]